MRPTPPRSRSRPLHHGVSALALRRRAFAAALRLDVLGHAADAEALLQEVARRQDHARGAMGDAPFQTWLDAVEAHLAETGQ